MYQIVAVLVGAVAGLTWEIIVNTPYKQFSALFSSRYINGFHVHHWLWYVLLLFITVLWSSKTGRLFHPAVLMVTSFLLVALAYGLSKFVGWRSF